jgi:MFS family permease
LLRFSTAAALAYTAYAMCRAPVLPLYARELGAGPELIGLVSGASTVTGVFLKLPAGALSDAIGRRAILLTAAAVFALLPFAYPLVASLALLVAVRVVHGSASALFGPTASAALSDLAPADQRGRWLGLYAAVQGSGQAAGPIVGGALLAAVGFAPTFVAAGLCGMAAATLLVAQPVGTRHGHAPGWPAIARSVAAVMQDGRIVLTSVAQAGQFMLHGLIAAFLPIYAVEHVGLTPTEAGLLFGAQMVMTIAARPACGRLSDRLGRRPLIVFGLSVCAAAAAAMALAASFLALLSLSLLYGGGLAITTTSTGALITDLSDRARYGTAHGLFGTIFDVGDALGPIVGGVVAARVGYAATFQAAAATAFVLAIVFGLASRRWVTSGG